MVVKVTLSPASRSALSVIIPDLVIIHDLAKALSSTDYGDVERAVGQRGSPRFSQQSGV